MRLVRIAAMNLRPGMFVAELDRPWLETPFAVQGFVVRDLDDILYVSKYVDEVLVDADYHGVQEHLTLAMEPTENSGATKLQLKSDFEQARASFESASKTMDRVFESLMKGDRADVAAVKDAVCPLIEGVFRNQEAVSALLRLKEVGEYRYNHGVSMAVWAVILGRHLGLYRKDLETLAIGSAMADVGMTTLPTKLLQQRGYLNAEQLAMMRSHPLRGAEMVAKSNDVDFEVLAIIENHHERMDGSGYPRGVAGATIPILARIVGLADTYDAMITARPYAPARTSHQAVQELLDVKGRLFQDSLVEQFIQTIGLFPTGSLVELSSGEIAIVVTQNSTRRLKPEVVVVTDEHKQKRSQLELLDLGNQDVVEDGERWIIHELLPGAYGIHSEEYFL